MFKKILKCIYEYSGLKYRIYTDVKNIGQMMLVRTTTQISLNHFFEALETDIAVEKSTSILLKIPHTYSIVFVCVVVNNVVENVKLRYRCWRLSCCVRQRVGCGGNTCTKQNTSTNRTYEWRHHARLQIFSSPLILPCQNNYTTVKSCRMDKI